MQLRALALAALLAAACRTPPPAAPSSDFDARLTKLEQRLDAVLGPATGDVPADTSIRLLRVEHRLDKILEFLKQAVRPELDTSVVYAVPIDPADPIVGPADAKVTIVEGFEFLCPYCAQVAPVIEQVAARYPRDVRVVSKYYVIHGPAAEPPGRAACAAAKQGKFAAMEKAVWSSIWPSTSQPPDRDHASVEELEKVARSVGLDLARFKKDMDGADCKDWLARSASTLEKFGAGGTPSFYINGRYVSGGMSLDDFVAMIDEEIARVDEAIAGGVARGKFYDTVVVGKGAPEGKMISPLDD